MSGLVDLNTNKILPEGGVGGSGAAGAALIHPAPIAQDPVGKLRVSEPQSLIDTDFEYGQQPTKWESIGLSNNRQGLYYIPQAPRTVTAVTGNNTRTVVISMADTTGFAVGTPIFVQNALDSNANGWYYVQAVSTNVSVTYTAAANVAAGNQFSADRTYVYLGFLYSQCGVNLSGTSAFTYVGTTTTVTTASAHGLSAGSLIYVTGVTSTAMNGTNGWISGTTMSLNAVPSAGLALRTGYTVTGAGVTAGTTITAVNNTTHTGQISGTTLSVTAGTAPVVGQQLSGTGVTAGTHVTAVNSAAFTGDITGTTLTYTAGTIPTIGMVITGAGVTAGTIITGGTSPTFTVNISQTVTSTALTGTSYTVNASQTVASTTITTTNYTVSASQTVGTLGAPVALSATSTSVADTPNGAWVVATTPNANTLTFTTVNTPFGTLSNATGQNTLFARTSGSVESRPFDGGVAFTAGAANPNSQMIRQTRRYFRYQSGKGIQFSTGTTLCPPLFVTDISSSGTTATVTTRYAHNLAPGAVILVTGADQAPYNGSFTVATVTSPTVFTYTMLQTPSSSPAQGFPIRVSPTNWFGSSNRVGFFDQQNGLFFEYDGQTLYAVWRSSVLQLEGTVTATAGSAAITGVGTKFARQLAPGDFIVIRGQSYRVLSIDSNTSMLVSPEYRGATVTGAIVSKTIDTRVPRSQWADPLDGTGPSGYTLDLTRMQMLYIEYSWYGAGYARFGLRTRNGNIAYVHQFTNNNVQYEAYLRSGNLPAHYESNGISSYTTLTSTLGTGGAGTIINVASTDGFAPSGVIRVSAPGGTGVVEHIAYSSRTATTFVVSARAQTGGQAAAQTFTFSATAPVLVEFASPDTLASLSHWGSSTIMDGRYDDDKSLVFNFGMTSAITTTATTPRVLMALRVAPSVDNNTIGVLGAREVINRMQLTLDSIGFYTTGTGYLINLVLNGFASGAFSGSFVSPVQEAGRITSSLAQVALNTNAVTVTGGESVYAGYTNPTGVTTLDLTKVRDLGNSILGGGTSNTVPTSTAGLYPDGPDILYVVAIPLSATSSTIQARINWKEAQA
ncbi:hypothetical protein UFOVP330_58 [uncultured Caudovirales phage]|uniref:Uncharacterized protein n=1 Tax=uncultured Caudovirales phage TaxID=2100421 RepID=A0A6J5M3I7_9CAUD|nr:hypothetical protein UFOVP330_58 [uncultured Caudovirales phage]